MSDRERKVSGRSIDNWYYEEYISLTYREDVLYSKYTGYWKSLNTCRLYPGGPIPYRDIRDHALDCGLDLDFHVELIQAMDVVHLDDIANQNQQNRIRGQQSHSKNRPKKLGNKSKHRKK